MMVASKKVDTLDFINCVKNYPEIFNTTHPGFKQQDDKNGAWSKIADEFNTDPTICKKKFRTLRERYTRELRRSYLEPGTPIKFEYFKHLSFLSPYIKFRSIMFETTEGKTIVTKREDLSMDKNEITSEIKILDADGYYEEDPNESAYQQENPGTSSIIYEASSAVDHQLHDYADEPQSQQLQLNDRNSDDEMLTLTNSKGKDRKRKSNWSDIDVDDDDGGNKHFAMSVACSLKRLNTINNLKAKVEIFQILEKYASKENE